ncbi:SH3 domain-containing protein [Rhodobacteraceae bacterium KMM 6894]|nr:SH3 domain-containing protein [Rhodobacteraceae bacterium KMM 6894]
MWRFILISFGFLGFAFYQLSGGADYAPSSNSLQVAWADKPFFAVPEPVEQQDVQIATATTPAVDDAVNVADAQSDTAPQAITQAVVAALEETPDEERVARADISLAGLSSDQFSRVNVTLAGAAQGFGTIQNASLGLSGVGSFSADTLVQDVRAVPLDQAVPAKPADIRSVVRSSANMRAGPGTDYQTVDQLSLGAPVQVLDHTSGWVRLRDLETGQTGWMADWLVTASN